MIHPRMMRELARAFEADGREACPVRIDMYGRIIQPSRAELQEQRRLYGIASELRHRADAALALRIVSVR
jgi:hypothetical protein